MRAERGGARRIESHAQERGRTVCPPALFSATSASPRVPRRISRLCALHNTKWGVRACRNPTWAACRSVGRRKGGGHGVTSNKILVGHSRPLIAPAVRLLSLERFSPGPCRPARCCLSNRSAAFPWTPSTPDVEQQEIAESGI